MRTIAQSSEPHRLSGWTFSHSIPASRWPVKLSSRTGLAMV